MCNICALNYKTVMREDADKNKWRHKACSLARKFNTVKMSSLPKLIDLCRTGQKFSVWKVCIRFKCTCKEGDANLSKGCSELIYFALFPSPPGALPCHLWTLACPQNIHTSGRMMAIYGKNHPNLLLTGCRTLGKSSCAAGLSANPENRVEFSTIICYGFCWKFLRWPQHLCAKCQ